MRSAVRSRFRRLIGLRLPGFRADGRAVLGAYAFGLLGVASLAAGLQRGPAATAVDATPPPDWARQVQQRASMRVDVALGDLSAINDRGRLRVLALDPHEMGNGSQAGLERTLIEDFARAHGLALDWRTVASRDALVRDLVAGRGDVIVDEVPVGFERDPRLGRTAPLRVARHVVVGRAGARGAGSTQDLLGKRVAIRESSPAWAVMERLAAAYPGIRVEAQPDYRDEARLLQGLARGDWDFMVGALDAVEPELARHPGLAVAFALTGDRPVSWKTRASSRDLRAALDDHLHRSPLLVPDAATYVGDLRSLQRRGVLRVITRADPDNYYLDRGVPAGFELELARGFAQAAGLRLEIVTARSAADMLVALRQGRGDLVIAHAGAALAGLAPGVTTSRAYYHVAPVLVGRAGAPWLDGRNPANRLRIVAHPTLAGVDALASALPAGTVLAANEPGADPVVAVVDGEVDAVAVPSHRVADVLAAHAGLVAGPSAGAPQPWRWAMRAADRGLRAAVDRYLRAEFRSAHFNALERRHFLARPEARLADDAGISRWDALARRYAWDYGFDWRLLVAVMFEESRFDPRAQSEAGARGLMQMLPATARALGVRDLYDPAQAVRAGAKYLDRLRGRFEADLPIVERTWFALAAYHGGYDRVRRARDRASRMGLDPDRWFGNVERAMAVLGTGTRDRSMRRTVAYVREIGARYGIYLQLTGPLNLAAAPARSRPDA